MRGSRFGRAGVLLVVGALAIPLAVASIAYACANLTTLYLNHSAVRSGGRLTGQGTNYSTDPKATQVVIHFKRRSGKVLWSGSPDLNGDISASFRIPHVRAGYYTLLAMQYKADGTAVAGTPGRAVVRVGRKHRAHRSSSHAVAVTPWASSPPGGTGDGQGLVATVHSVVPAGALVASLVLFVVLLGSGLFILVGSGRLGRGRLSHPERAS